MVTITSPCLLSGYAKTLGPTMAVYRFNIGNVAEYVPFKFDFTSASTPCSYHKTYSIEVKDKNGVVNTKGLITTDGH